MVKQEAKQRCPFHESIIEAIKLCDNRPEMVIIGTLINMTEILKGHDKILAIWDQRLMSLFNQNLIHAGDRVNLRKYILTGLTEQKREAREAEEKEKFKEQK